MSLTDEKLYELCRLYGERARIWRQKFLGLLPEVYKRELHKHKGFGSIHEFAAKLAGVSERQVDLVLNLERKFQNKPDLYCALVDGEVSVNKLARVASIATSENQKFLMEQAKNLPKSALEVFVQDEKNAQAEVHSLPGHHANNQLQILQPVIPNPELSDEVKQKLCVLQQKGIDINVLILEALERRGRDIEAEKQKLAGEEAARVRTRHIPVKIERLVRQEYGSKCAVPGCGRDCAHIHHEIPFAMIRSHNPYFLKPLCEEHHVIAHNINLAYQRSRGP